MLGITIHNASIQNKPVGISFRRRDQLSVDAIWSVFEVTQSDSRFNTLDTLSGAAFGYDGRRFRLHGHQDHGTADFGNGPFKEYSTSQVRNELSAHALIIAIAKVTNDPNYTAYRKGRKIYPKVEQLLATTGISLDNGGESPNSNVFRTILDTIRSLCTAG